MKGSILILFLVSVLAFAVESIGRLEATNATGLSGLFDLASISAGPRPPNPPKFPPKSAIKVADVMKRLDTKSVQRLVVVVSDPEGGSPLDVSLAVYGGDRLVFATGKCRCIEKSGATSEMTLGLDAEAAKALQRFFVPENKLAVIVSSKSPIKKVRLGLRNTPEK